MDELDGSSSEREEVLSMTSSDGGEQVRADGRRIDAVGIRLSLVDQGRSQGLRRERDTGLGQIERGITRSACGTSTASSAAASTMRRFQGVVDRHLGRGQEAGP